MANSFLKSLSVFIALTTVVPVYAGIAEERHREPLNVHIQGLNRIAVDTWTRFLTEGRSEGLNVLDAREQVRNVLVNSKNEAEVFQGIKKVMAEVKVVSSNDYRDLGIMLLELRQELRQQKVMTMKARQDSLFLMELLAEESLFVGSKKFADFPKEISVVGQAKSSGMVANLRNFKVQTGDLVLSKSTGFGSSSFITLVGAHPHIYSHSTPIYVSDEGDLLSPEAEIEDGVKLRSMIKDYVDGSKTRATYYRYQGAKSGVLETVATAMRNFVSEMYTRTGGDPFNKAAFLYDFSMTPGDANSRGLFCSSVGLEIYKRAGFSGNENPYPESVWSPITKGREILLKALNMNTEKVPAPGDLELNSDFHLVGTRIDVTKLGQERVEAAIMDVFLSELDHNRDLLKNVSETLTTVAAKPVDKNSLKKMAYSGLLPKQLAEKLSVVDKIPDSINLKQMVFFAFLNDVMTPKVRAAIMKQIEVAETKGEIVGPIEIRKMAREQGLSMMSEVRAMQAKIIAITGIGLCSKVWN